MAWRKFFMVKREIRRILVLLLCSIACALIIRFPLIWEGWKGELVLRPDLHSQPQAPMQIDLASARQQFEKKTAQFVDARPSLFYKMGHIPGAMSFPREDYERGASLVPLAAFQNKPLVIYCSGHDCPDSSILAAHLQKKGFTQISLFNGGFPAWKEAQLPVETTP
jgi:rhodanese-related sulfurtransferase